MSLEGKPVLYEGMNTEESDKVRDFFKDKGIGYRLGFGDCSRFKDLPFPVVSVGIMDLYGPEAIERYSFR